MNQSSLFFIKKFVDDFILSYKKTIEFYINNKKNSFNDDNL